MTVRRTRHHPRAVAARAEKKPPRLSSLLLVMALATAAVAIAAQIFTHLVAG